MSTDISTSRPARAFSRPAAAIFMAMIRATAKLVKQGSLCSIPISTANGSGRRASRGMKPRRPHPLETGPPHHTFQNTEPIESRIHTHESAPKDDVRASSEFKTMVAHAGAWGPSRRDRFAR